MVGDSIETIIIHGFIMSGSVKKRFTGVFRDGGAGSWAGRRYAERRRKLMRREGKLIALTGVPYGPGQETGWAYAHLPTYQEPAIMYLTGINQSKVILLLDPSSRRSKEILFIDRKNREMEFWDGYRFGVGDPKSLDEVRKVTGFTDIRDIAEFESVLCKRFQRLKKKELGTLWLAGKEGNKKRVFKGDHNWNFKVRLERLLKKWKAPKDCLKNIMENHFDLRLPLDKYDVENSLRANLLTTEAFKATLKEFRGLRNECEVGGFLEGQMLMRSPYGLSFPSIIASGSNATILHYMKNDDDFLKDEMVLMDFGVRWMTMHADISRTVPASGKFNPLQKLLYEIVLKAQRVVQRKARAGTTIKELNDVCWNSINNSLENEFVAVGGRYKLKYERSPHGVSHLMGEQEHDGDPFRIYTNIPMKAGWVISNEPGVYGKFHLKVGKKVWSDEIGIRIEDNLLITKTGCVNLSNSMPKTVAQIERLMGLKGI